MHVSVLTAVAAAMVAFSPAPVLARGDRGHSTRVHSSSHTATSRVSNSSGSHASGHSSSSHSPPARRASGAGLRSSSHAAYGVNRDSHGKIKRSAEVKSAFKRSHPCPSTGKSSGACPGYVVDHVKPLKRGGADAPENMQWQTKADAKAKDKWE